MNIKPCHDTGLFYTPGKHPGNKTRGFLIFFREYRKSLNETKWVKQAVVECIKVICCADEQRSNTGEQLVNTGGEILISKNLKRKVADT